MAETTTSTGGPAVSGANTGVCRSGVPAAALRSRQERLLDEALEETFPASDPVAVMRLT